MKTNKKSSKRLTIVAACIAIALCLSSIVGGTLALFTQDISSSNNVLQAGNLNVKLERVALQSTYLDDDGILQQGPKTIHSTPVDFTDTDKNIFGLADTDVIVPRSKHIAYMKLTNLGTVAFDFTVTLQKTDDPQKDKDLAEQLEVKLCDLQGNALTTGSVNKGDNLEFMIVLEFKDLSTNNAVMDAGALINVNINCTQKVNV